MAELFAVETEGQEKVLNLHAKSGHEWSLQFAGFRLDQT